MWRVISVMIFLGASLCVRFAFRTSVERYAYDFGIVASDWSKKFSLLAFPANLSWILYGRRPIRWTASAIFLNIGYIFELRFYLRFEYTVQLRVVTTDIKSYNARVKEKMEIDRIPLASVTTVAAADWPTLVVFTRKKDSNTQVLLYEHRLNGATVRKYNLSREWTSEQSCTAIRVHGPD